MEERIGIVGILLDSNEFAAQVNDVLHAHSGLILGRMGLPYREYGVSVISLIVKGTTDEISSLTGQLGQIEGVNVKSAMHKEILSK